VGLTERTYCPLMSPLRWASHYGLPVLEPRSARTTCLSAW